MEIITTEAPAAPTTWEPVEDSQPTALIRWIRPGVYNPRKFFDPATMTALEEAIRAAGGVLQPILVRRMDDQYFGIIAGERRYRAAKAVYGDDYRMPITVKDVDDETAAAMSIIENVARADMAPSEEAVAAARLVGKFKGDRDEVARMLGWSRTVLDKRLALMNCSSAVLDSLNERKIKLGHAELLAALAKEKQDKLLPVLISESKTVEELKKVIEGVACSLSSAIFDKSQCATCQYNSELQTELFGESIGTGNCTNRSCFTEKSEAQLQVIEAGMKDEYPLVRIVRSGDNHTRVQLVVEGPTGVGAEQAKACHACVNFGAAVSGLPDSMGKVFRGQCFDTGCNQKKVAAQLAATKAANAESKSITTKGAAGAAKSGAPGKVSVEKAVTTVSETDRVKAYRVALWRKCLRREVAADPSVANHYLLSVCLSDLGRKIEGTTMRKLFERIVPDETCQSGLSPALAVVAPLSGEQRHSLTVALAVAAVEGVDVSDLVTLCKYQKLDLRKYWKLSKDFLDLLTKSEMKVVADEIGLLKAMGDTVAKTFAKPKPELIEALLKIDGFDYAGKVPRVLLF